MASLPREKESKIQRSMIVRLRRYGLVLYRRNVGSREWADKSGATRLVQYGARGQSDLYGWHIRTGRHFEIEVKRPGNKPTEMQLKWLKDCHRLGAVAFWSDSVAIAEMIVEAILGGGVIVWHDDENFDVEA